MLSTSQRIKRHCNILLSIKRASILKNLRNNNIHNNFKWLKYYEKFGEKHEGKNNDALLQRYQAEMDAKTGAQKCLV